MRRYPLLTLIVLTVVLAGCGSRETGHQGISYPPTKQVDTVFQKNKIPASCRVFAHIFATMPAGYSGKQFVDAVTEEARGKGADMMLLGQSRQCTSGSELDFTYYGPDREYRIGDWPGWNFGFEEWQEQGEWASIGYAEWGSDTVHYDYPIVMQVIFLRCQG